MEKLELKRKPKFIYFDAGNVLVEGELHKKPLIADLLGIKVEEYDNTIQTFLNGSRIALDWEFWNIRTIDEELLYVKKFNKELCTFLNIANIPTTVDKILDIWVNNDCILKDETIEVLTCLKGKYRMGILTNATPIRRQSFRRLGIDAFMDQIVISFEEGFHKPNEIIYNIAAKKAEVSLSEILFIDDKESYIEGALKAGIDNSLLFSDNAHPQYTTIQNLKDILPLLLKY